MLDTYETDEFPVGPLEEIEPTSVVVFKDTAFPLAVPTIPQHDPWGPEMKELKQEYKRTGDQQLRGDIRQIYNDFYSDLAMQLSHEDTVVCAASGEIALRLANTLLNSEPAPGTTDLGAVAFEENSKLCFTAYRPAWFHHRVTDRNHPFKSLADAKAVEELIKSSKRKDARVLESTNEFTTFVNACIRSASSPRDCCWVCLDGSAAGVFQAGSSNTREVADALWKAGQFQQAYKSPISKRKAPVFGVLAVPCPEDVIRSILNFGGPTCWNPVLSLRVGAFAPQDYTAWQAIRDRATKAYNDVLESFGPEGGPEAQAEADRAADEQTAKAVKNNPAVALALAADPADFALKLLKLDLSAAELSALPAPAGWNPEIGLFEGVPQPDTTGGQQVWPAYAGDIAFVAGGSYVSIGPAYAAAWAVRDAIASDNPDWETGSGAIYGATLTWDRMALLFGPPMHLFEYMKIDTTPRAFHLAEVLRISDNAPHEPEPARIGGDEKARAREIAQRIAPGATPFLGEDNKITTERLGIRDEVPTLIMMDPSATVRTAADVQRDAETASRLFRRGRR